MSKNDKKSKFLNCGLLGLHSLSIQLIIGHNIMRICRLTLNMCLKFLLQQSKYCETIPQQQKPIGTIGWSINVMQNNWWNVLSSNISTRRFYPHDFVLDMFFVPYLLLTPLEYEQTQEKIPDRNYERAIAYICHSLQFLSIYFIV